MEMYRNRKAYKNYLNICRGYGIESINFDRFIKNLTEEQLDEYYKLAV